MTTTKQPPFAVGELVRVLPSANDPEAGRDRYTTYDAPGSGHNRGLEPGDECRVSGHYWAGGVSVTMVEVLRHPEMIANVISVHLVPAPYGNEE